LDAVAKRLPVGGWRAFCNNSSNLITMLTYKLTFLLTVVGVIYILLGLVLPFIPRNRIMGYRTTQTLASKQQWKLANKDIGAIFLSFGVIFIITAFVIYKVFTAFADNTTIAIISVLPIVVIFIRHVLYKQR
jgi:uncharacterized membrane protein